VLANIKRHSDNSPFLIGGNQPGDKVTLANQVSYISGQISLF
jgi:enamine deaminase RidA (YjgF/YER057c/UK114 family)